MASEVFIPKRKKKRPVSGMSDSDLVKMRDEMNEESGKRKKAKFDANYSKSKNANAAMDEADKEVFSEKENSTFNAAEAEIMRRRNSVASEVFMPKPKQKGSSGRESAHRQRRLRGMSKEMLAEHEMRTQPVPMGKDTKYDVEHNAATDEVIRRKKAQDDVDKYLGNKKKK